VWLQGSSSKLGVWAGPTIEKCLRCTPEGGHGGVLRKCWEPWVSFRSSEWENGAIGVSASLNVEDVTVVAVTTLVSRSRLVVFAAFAGLLMAACGTGGFSGSTIDVACSITGSTRFPVSYLCGPEYSPAEFIDTETGSVLKAFFLGGEGEPENQQYLESDGFS